MFQHLPDKKLYCEPGHVDNLDDGKDPEIPEDLVGTVVVCGEGVQGEDHGGEDDAEHGEHGDDPGPGRGVRLLEEVPDPALRVMHSHWSDPSRYRAPIGC